MADETDHTPDRHKIVCGDEDNSKDNGAGKPKVVKKRDPVVPHYLRASTGSCHDACKYGKPHVFKDKPWKPKNRRVSAPPPDTEKPADIQIFVDKKVKVILQTRKPESSVPPNFPPDVEIKKHIPSTRKSPEVSLPRDSVAPNFPPDFEIKKHIPSTRKSPEVSLPRDSVAPNFPPDVEIKKHIPSTRKSPEVSLPRDSLPADEIKKHIPSTRKLPEPKTRKSPDPNFSKVVKQEANFFLKSPTPESSKDAKKVVQSSGKFLSPDTLTPIKQEVSSTAKTDVSSKQASLNSRERNSSEGPSKANICPMVLSSSVGKTTNVNSRVSFKKNMAPLPTVLSSKKSPKVEVKRILNSSIIGPSRKSPVSSPGSSNLRRSKTPNLKTQTFPKNQMITKKVESGSVEEKTVHMIETEEDCLSSAAQNGSPFIQSPSSLSPESLNSSSQETSHSSESHDEEDLGSEYTDSEIEDLKEAKGKGSVKKDMDPSSSMKLKFRRGKTVEPQPETNGSRRLRFRKGKTAEVNPDNNGIPRRRSYRKRDTDSGKKVTERDSVKVVLKHQEIETKKDAPVLLNNVIEETASKLAKARKSKVKALVGAFESVISLQESKPSSVATSR